jgi:hypothetical protein
LTGIGPESTGFGWLAGVVLDAGGVVLDAGGVVLAGAVLEDPEEPPFEEQLHARDAVRSVATTWTFFFIAIS